MKTRPGTCTTKLVLIASAGLACGCQVMDPAISTNAGETPAAGAPAANAPAKIQPVSQPAPPRDPGKQAGAEELAQSEPPKPRAMPRLASANVSRVTFAQEGADFDPCVSRDGERLVYASTQHRTTADIYLKKINSKVVTQLTNDPADDVMPAISPDGSRIAFASNRAGSWDIFVMPSSGGRAVQITSDPTDELHATWSPDGKNLVFCRLGEASGRWEMWVVDATNSASATFIGYGLFPQWCPVAGSGMDQSDRILFQLGRDRGKRTFGLWVLDYKQGQASNQTEIASSSDSALINPTWSPDGQWIAFAEVPATGASADEKGRASKLPHDASIWMIGVDGTGKVSLATGPGASLMPVWAPDHRLYFVSNRGGAENVWAMDMKSALLAATGTMPQTPAVANVAEPAGTPGEEHE